MIDHDHPADPVDDEGRPQGPAPDSDHAHTLGQSVRRAGMGSIFDDPAQRPNRSSTAVKIARDRQLRDRDTAQARRAAADGSGRDDDRGPALGRALLVQRLRFNAYARGGCAYEVAAP